MTTIPSAPIPGANYASDTRNYPWHRPADIEGYDEAVDYVLSRLKRVSGVSLVYSMLEIEADIATITSAMLLQEVSKGKMQIDMAIVIAGPVARGIELFAKRHGLKYEMGADAEDELVYTPTELRMLLESEEQSEEEQFEMAAAPAPVEEPMDEGGLMAVPAEDDIEAAPEDEQQAMLGMAEEEAEDGLER